ncbi:methyltransferase domain-containing protein [Sphingosinicella sp. BN140058]|uniref:methyltransferase domain-containing protein n=1 Tax=Sphingosinicella sp. BN140058 TaxID=1892855 RepID=UPI00101173E6|nr:methyltransferase domain-containing protein [Sphingosinicella sp. BN140058]QAY78877.1 methyltransferase domain-containing protein [Sphingosinicella sp. BN140058]
MSQDTPFDRRLRRLRRDRAAGRFAGADYLHRLIGEDLLDRLDSVTRSFGHALVLGAADPAFGDGLSARGLAVTFADPSFAFARAVEGVQCDEDRLPFADGAFDLVVSIGLLDTVNDLPGALLLIRRALVPDGLFLAAFAGAGTLPRLRAAMMAADEADGGIAARVHPQIDVRAAGDLLSRAGFALPVVDSHGVNVRFSGLMRLIADLRAMAATNVLAARAGRPISRYGLAAAIADFAAHAEGDGKTTERFEILHLLGWAPAPSQPKPARRGSATTSLAAALKPR